MNRRVLWAGLLLIVPLLAVLRANLGRDPHLIDSPLVGHPAPPFLLTKLSGGAPLGLEQFKGKPVVLNFWATWCVPCMQEHPTLAATATALRDKVQFLGVVFQDEQERVAEFIDTNGAPYPTLLDPEGKAAVAYGVQGVPETYFIDARGVIVSKVAAPLSPDSLARELDKLRP